MLLKPLLTTSAKYVAGTVASGAIPTVLVQKNDIWYETLKKPSWNPPNYAFPIIWTVLNTMIGLSASYAVPGHTGAKISFFLNRILSIIWTPVFFMNKNLRGATDLSRTILLSAFYMMYKFSHNKLAVKLLVPYVLWLYCATVLSSKIEQLNTYK